MAPRRKLKLLRLVERAALDAGAERVTWESGKHPRMWIHLPDGRRIHRVIPGSSTLEQTWIRNVRSKVRRALQEKPR